MSFRESCYDNAVAESFFANLKKENVRRVKYQIRADMRLTMFNYIEMFYNPKHRHTHNNRVSLAQNEQKYSMKQKVVYES